MSMDDSSQARRGACSCFSFAAKMKLLFEDFSLSVASLSFAFRFHAFMNEANEVANVACRPTSDRSERAKWLSSLFPNSGTMLSSTRTVCTCTGTLSATARSDDFFYACPLSIRCPVSTVTSTVYSVASTTAGRAYRFVACCLVPLDSCLHLCFVAHVSWLTRFTAFSL
jgi:hypothetical protein